MRKIDAAEPRWGHGFSNLGNRMAGGVKPRRWATYAAITCAYWEPTSPITLSRGRAKAHSARSRSIGDLQRLRGTSLSSPTPEAGEFAMSATGLRFSTALNSAL